MQSITGYYRLIEVSAQQYKISFSTIWKGGDTFFVAHFAADLSNSRRRQWQSLWGPFDYLVQHNSFFLSILFSFYYLVQHNSFLLSIIFSFHFLVQHYSFLLSILFPFSNFCAKSCNSHIWSKVPTEITVLNFEVEHLTECF